MSLLVCPYTGQEFPGDEATPEHIIPLSAGGHDDFVVPASKSGNDEAGLKIDGKFIANPLIAMKRVQFGLLGHSRAEPQLISDRSFMDFPFNKQPYKAVISRSRGVQHNFIDLKQPISDPASGNIGQRFVYNDEKQRKSFLNSLKPSEREHLQEGEFRTNELTARFRVNPNDINREFLKIALAYGCYVFGNNFARTAEAGLLRNEMWKDFPVISEAETSPTRKLLEHWLCRDGNHTVAILTDGFEIVCFISLFGEICTLIPITREVHRYQIPDEGVITFVDYINKRVEKGRVKVEFRNANSVT